MSVDSHCEQNSGLVICGLSTPVLDGIDLSVTHGQGCAVVGPSGSGKTSLFRAITDLDPNHGTVKLDGQDRSSFAAPDWRTRVAYVPAEPAWWLHLAGDHANADARRIAATLGVANDLLDKPITMLSTGERQRLALAIAFARQPQVLLLDEPTSALDEGNRDDVESAIRAHVDDGGILLIASHDKAQVARLELTVLRLEDGRLTDSEAGP